jgi:serine protease Do
MARWPIALVSLAVGGLLGAVIMTTNLQGQAPPQMIYPKELSSYRDIVKQVLPAVVSVESKPKAVARQVRRAPQQQRQFDLPPGIPEEFRGFFGNMNPFGEMPEDLTPRQRHSFGSGFVIDAKGVILTNYHVVDGSDRVEITLNDGSKYTSTDIKGDKKNDLAIVHIKANKPLPYLVLGDSDAMEIGDRVLALGAPFGLTGSVTSGIVSAKGRSNIERRDRAVYEDYLQTDAAINPGNSGGPLVNLEGRVIGINTAIKSESGGWQGVGFAITSNVARGIVDQLQRFGVVHRGYLGVQVGAITPDVAEKLGVPADTGVVVSSVVDNSPAGKAGLQPGDVIVRVGDHAVKNGRELQHVVGSLTLNQPVQLVIVRDGQSKNLTVKIEEQPKDYGLAQAGSGRSFRSPGNSEEEVKADKVGLKLSDMTAELAKRYGYSENATGALITSVADGTVAAEVQMQAGELITKINKKAVTSAEAAATALQRADLSKGVLVQVQIPPTLGGGTQFFVLKSEVAQK